MTSVNVVGFNFVFLIYSRANHVSTFMSINARICFIIILLACFFKKTEAQSINFKILNPKKIYALKDKFRLSVENVTNKPLHYLVGKEFYDHDYNTWIEYEMDIKNDPLKDQPGRYEVIPPHKLKLITVNLRNTGSRPTKKHGLSIRNRFCLRYHNINAFIKPDDPKLVTVEFAESW